jgi:hypothetical protein
VSRGSRTVRPAGAATGLAAGQCPTEAKQARRSGVELPVTGGAIRKLQGHVAAPLPEGEHVCLGARLQEGDLQGPVADRVVGAHELVQAAVPEQTVAVLVEVHAV